jgi:glycyl-tRNA synthetase
VHILEIAFGVDRLIFSLLDIYYDKKAMDLGKSIWRIPYGIAPVKISIFPLVKNKPELLVESTKIYNLLKRHYITEYDEKQSIGKRYLKSGIKGVPYCVTIDHQTLLDNTVTIRDRDTENQVRINSTELVQWFREKIINIH